MTGRLRSLGYIMQTFSNDLSSANATADEQGAAIVLSALHAAIVLDQLPALVALVEDWYDANEAAALAKMAEEKRVAALGESDLS